MKAAVFMGANAPFEVREYPVVAPEKGMVRLGLIASGICGTDEHIRAGRLDSPAGTIIGHEFVGRVEEIGPDTPCEAQVGDAVLTSIAVPCGKCALCLQGDDANCVNMAVTNGEDANVAPYFHGGYGEENFCPAGNMVKLPASVDPTAAAVFACAGPTVLHAISLAKQANVDFSRAKVAVVQGMGPVGMFAVMAFAAMGIPNVVAVTARSIPRRNALAKKLGATLCIGLDENPDPTAQILALGDGLGADVVLEASGRPAAFPMGLGFLRNRGTYLVPGQYSNSGAIPVEPQLITFKALRILGSSQYSMVDVRTYVDFLVAHPECVEKQAALATAYPVSQVNEAFAGLREHIKTVLVKG